MSRSIIFDILARDRASSTMGRIGRAAGLLGGAIGVGSLAAFAKSAVTAQAEFGQLMNTLQAASGASAQQMAALDKMAMKLGADTAFSAKEAAGAMLELSKAGITTSDIMGGGVAGTLTLAAAGGTDLATAATIASNSMNTFSLAGKDMASIAAALAGGANASSASVESLGEGLRQVGPGAKNAGLSLQETVAALSAFDAAGLKGSDGGTSLKTMLARLVPTTEKAASAMDAYGLSFVKPNGEFKNLTTISQQLQDRLGGLSEAQRVQALSTIFGSDASRAATVLMTQGAEGIRKYIAATNDQTAAQKMAEARMKGAAGTIERLKGSFETASLVLGKKLEPTFIRVGNFLADHMVPGMMAAIHGFEMISGFASDNAAALTALGVVIVALTAVTVAHSVVLTVQAAGGLLKYLASTKLVTLASKVWAATQWALNAALAANPIGLVVVAIAALAVALVVAYKRSETFRAAVDVAFHGIASAGKWMWNTVLQPVFKYFALAVSGVLFALSKLFGALASVPGAPKWIGTTAQALDTASEKVLQLSNRIKDIPDRKDVTINVRTVQSGGGGGAGGGHGFGPQNDYRVSGKNAGHEAYKQLGMGF